MKIEMKCDDKFIVYLNKEYYTFDKTTIEKCLTNIIKRLKKIYNIEIYSSFNIDCYINNNYGIIFVIKREYDPFSLYTKKTDLNLVYHENTLFLYEIDDIFLKNKLSNYSLYLYNNKIYIDIKDSNINPILEHINSILFNNNKVLNNKLNF